MADDATVNKWLEKRHKDLENQRIEYFNKYMYDMETNTDEMGFIAIGGGD